MNTIRPQQRRLLSEAIAFHETIPGHHTCFAVPAAAGNTNGRFNPGYAEGWAVYAESLADEMGLYSSTLDRIGLITKRLWTASRLVVEPVPPPVVPRPPAHGETLAAGALAGTWEGEMQLNVPSSLSIRFSDNSPTKAHGSARVRIGRTVLDQSLENLAIEGGVVAFVIPLEHHGEFRFGGAYVDGAIRGIGRLVFGSRVVAIATTELVRKCPSQLRRQHGAAHDYQTGVVSHFYPDTPALGCRLRERRDKRR